MQNERKKVEERENSHIWPLTRLDFQTLPHNLPNRLTDYHLIRPSTRRTTTLVHSSRSRPSWRRLFAARPLVRKPPVAAQHANRERSARLVAAHLKGRFADQTRVQRAAHGPDVDLGVDDRTRFYIKEFWGPVRHRAVLGGRVLGGDGQGARGDWDRRDGDGTEVHEDGPRARVVDHDVACARNSLAVMFLSPRSLPSLRVAPCGVSPYQV